jgi:phospholipid transport system substrate-binding protein
MSEPRNEESACCIHPAGLDGARGKRTRKALDLPRSERHARTAIDLDSAVCARCSSPAMTNFPPRKGTPAVRDSYARLTIGSICMLFLAPAHVSAAKQATASAAVQSLHDTLTGAMKQAESLGYQGRFELIAPAVNTYIDQEFMAAKSIGREWKKLSSDDQERWLKSFSDLTVANYAGRFKGYSGEHFVLESEEDAPHDTKLVKTVLILPKEDDVKLNYRLRETGTGWKIIDVYMNGTVSELSLRRSEYSSKVKREGFKSLIAAVEQKLADFAGGKVTDANSPVVSSASN